MDENKEQETNLPAAPAEGAPAAEEAAEDGLAMGEAEEEALPAEDKIFGLPRRTFHLVVVGYAVGVILVGLLGIAGLVDEGTNTLMPGVVCAGIGYLIARRLDKRDAEKKDAGGVQE